jgi:putative oxidoreductase
MKIVKTILAVLFGLMFINAGLNKFFNYMPMPQPTPEEMKIFAAFGTLVWLMPLLGVMEVVGGILFIIPKTRALGALVVFPIVVGIVLHHATLAPSGMGIVIPLLLINLWVIVDNWKKYEVMLK